MSDPLAIDPATLENTAASDSGIDDNSFLASETTSVHSSIYRYRYENGRRYHAYKDGEYWGPNDERAQDHLDIAHNLWLKTMDGKLALAPVGESGKVGKVLDVGCGTGIWAIDFADAHPEAEVVGTDLSPTQPTWVPPNCRFEIDDANDDSGWTWPSNSFDFIHVRSLFGCISDWPRFYREAFRVLRPGGYIEHVEMGRKFSSPDDSIPPDSALAELDGLGEEACRRIGKPGDVLYRMKGWLEEAGVWEDVTQVEYKWPTGPWPKDRRLKELGQWSRLHLLEGLENWCLAMLTRVMGYSYEEAQVWIARIRRDIKDPKIHAYHDMYVCYARKPTGV
ncbi:Methyltransferase type 11 [Macrophomina phaseolina MS6]|uniref:Methyltransferase type 11 n=2 Tax=Macrophomina phaseolina TaxID=35725 RepID=K2QL73_MACPH|nr:Methyltransferase type 11 [Macrophomina phaseolina MS6]KAH7043784.1 S-adenosyl-L-methionine-dependent methyltransferase [Macrophomina phaseolina]